MSSTHTQPILERIMFGGPEGDQDIYKMSEKTRGYCAIFLFEKFQDHSLNRLGSERDMDLLKSEIQNMNFDLHCTEGNGIYRDQTEIQVMKILDEIVDDTFALDRHDAFVAIFSSHGLESKFFDYDSQPILVSKIIEKFSNINCPSLANKPKIFIFLCCRGNNLPLIVEEENFEEEPYCFDSGVKKQTGPKFSDIIICYSTVFNYVSLRHEIFGTFYGNFLAQNLSRFAHNKDFEYILRKTAQDLTNEENLFIEVEEGNETKIVELKMMCSVKMITWRKMLYFNPQLSR